MHLDSGIRCPLTLDSQILTNHLGLISSLKPLPCPSLKPICLLSHILVQTCLNYGSQKLLWQTFHPGHLTSTALSVLHHGFQPGLLLDSEYELWFYLDAWRWDILDCSASNKRHLSIYLMYVLTKWVYTNTQSAANCQLVTSIDPVVNHSISQYIIFVNTFVDKSIIVNSVGIPERWIYCRVCHKPKFFHHQCYLRSAANCLFYFLHYSSILQNGLAKSLQI